MKRNEAPNKCKFNKRWFRKGAQARKWPRGRRAAVPKPPPVQPLCQLRHVKGSDETVGHRSPTEVQQFTWFSALSWRRERRKTGITPATRPHTQVQPRRANNKRGGLNNEMHMKYKRGRGIVAGSSPAADANTLKRWLAHLAACLACFHAWLRIISITKSFSEAAMFSGRICSRPRVLLLMSQQVCRRIAFLTTRLSNSRKQTGPAHHRQKNSFKN